MDILDPTVAYNLEEPNTEVQPPVSVCPPMKLWSPGWVPVRVKHLRRRLKGEAVQTHVRKRRRLRLKGHPVQWKWMATPT